MNVFTYNNEKTELNLKNPDKVSLRLKFNIEKLKIHIYPVKGLSESMLADTIFPALIVCSSRWPRLNKARFMDNFCALHFQDIIDIKDDDAFRMAQAEMIRDFLIGLPEEISDLFICCDGGDARSPSIAAAIMRFIGRSEEKVWNNPFYTPNILVYFRLCCAFGIQISWEEALEKNKQNDLAYRNAQENCETSYERWEIL